MEFMSQPEEVWSSKLSRSLKVRLFLATVESVLLYGAETWTLTKTLKIQGLPKVTSKIQQRRMRLAGNCIRHDDEAEEYRILELW